MALASYMFLEIGHASLLLQTLASSGYIWHLHYSLLTDNPETPSPVCMQTSYSDPLEELSLNRQPAVADGGIWRIPASAIDRRRPGSFEIALAARVFFVPSPLSSSFLVMLDFHQQLAAAEDPSHLGQEPPDFFPPISLLRTPSISLSVS